MTADTLRARVEASGDEKLQLAYEAALGLMGQAGEAEYILRS